MLAGTSKQSGQDSFDNISMTRQLKTKKQARSRIKRTPIKRTMNTRSNSQNQPMPTFKDLEKMFEEPATIHSAPDPGTSNSINRSTSLSTTEVSIPISLNITENSRKDVNTDNSHHSDVKVKIPDRINCDTSFETINLINTVMTKVIDCNEVITIDDDEPETINQDRKRKQNCVKLEDVDSKKPQKVRKLENLDLPKDDNGSDSDVTVEYDLEAPPVLSPVSSSLYKRFSPLPSTSTDSETILKNDKIFMECLSANNSCIEIQEVSRTDKQELPDVIDIDELPSVSISTRIESSEPIEIDDVVTTSIDDEIDIDEIIAYNRSILTKYKTVEDLPAVIEVAPVPNIANNVTHNVSDYIEVIDSPAIRQNTNRRIPSVAATDIPSFTNATTSSTVTAPIGTPSRNIPRSTNISNIMLTNRNISSINNPINNSLQSGAQSNINQMFTPTIVNTTSLASSSQSPEVSTGLNCPICLDNLRSTECASTLCGHIFCMDCIKRALRSSKRCPTCRKTIKGNNGYHRLFL